MVYAAAGSAAPDFDGAARPGKNLFANCVLAPDASTGKRLWHFQTVRHDLWDYDNASAPVLCTLRKRGKVVDAIAVLTKTGACFVLDRATGAPLFLVKEVPAGRQYDAIAASGGGLLKNFGFDRGPERHALVAFALPR